jgi:hypothetical protein
MGFIGQILECFGVAADGFYRYLRSGGGKEKTRNRLSFPMKMSMHRLQQPTNPQNAAGNQDMNQILTNFW